MRNSAKVDARKLRGIERREQAYALRKAGRSERSIAEELGISRRRVRDYMAEAYDATLEVPQAELRAIELERLDDDFAHLGRAIDVIAKKVDRGDTKAIDTTARVIATRARLAARRSKLLGLDHRDAPPVIPPPVTVSTSWDFSGLSDEKKVALREIMLDVKQRVEVSVSQNATTNVVEKKDTKS